MLRFEITIEITQNLTEVIEQSRLISFERPYFDRSDTEQPCYGIYSNQGTMTFNDLFDDFLGYAENEQLQDGLTLKIELVDTVTGLREEKGAFKTSDWRYTIENKQVSVNFADDLTEWQDIKPSDLQIIYNASIGTSGTGKTVYDFLYAKTPAKYNMLAFNSLDNATKQVLNDTVMEKLALQIGNLWQQWTKLCEACGLVIYKGEDNTTVCKAVVGV